MFIKIREGFILNKVMSLHDAVAKYVENGDTLAIGGFTTNRKPYATVSEILRQGQKDFIVYAGPGGGEVLLTRYAHRRGPRGCLHQLLHR